ncbi:hypothetical protein BT93_H3260 [Corymbia citriodora subsp. variegata]|nr:hypothetical protein BT93_H3260 [Corymbia citriodora subsp. variegata]
MASTSPPAAVFNAKAVADDSHRKKRRKIDAADDAAEEARGSREAAAGGEVRWKSPAQQRLYSTKLVEALSRSRRSSSTAAETEAPAPAAPPTSGAGEVRGIADRVLATTAKGRTRWSRAILASRLRMSRLGKHHKKARAPAGRGRLKKPPSTTARALEGGGRMRRLPAVERRAKVLGRLVPGCRGIPVSSLLEETSDYIAALEMQVRAMTVLTQLLSGSSQPPQQQPPPRTDQLGSSSG